MKLIDSLSGYRNFKKYRGEIGLEIETETKSPYQIPEFAFWNVHGDGSLRDFGQEYVLKQPLQYQGELDEALTEFAAKTKGIKFIQDSITTSVHTHLNVLNETPVTLGNLITAYTLVENLLIRFSGDDRRSNLFCLPVCDAEETYKNCVKMFSTLQARNYGGMIFHPDHTKYAAMNLSAIGNYGSLEFRSFRGTTDIKLIHKWISLLYSLLKFSRQDITPPMIVEGWRDRGSELLTEIFEEHRKDIRLDNENDLIEKNFWYAASIAYSVKDWKSLIQEKKKAASKDLDAMAQKLYAKKFDDLSNAQKNKVIAASRDDNFLEALGGAPRGVEVLPHAVADAGPAQGHAWIEQAFGAGARAGARAQVNPVNEIVIDDDAEAEFLEEAFEDEEDL